MTRGPDAAARRLARAARAKRLASTRPTTRPGSETTGLTVGDHVRVARQNAPTGGWSRYAGRNGTVVALNTETFPNGTTYVEVGACFGLTTGPTAEQLANARADAWFRADELQPVLL